jgi:hypothetical protein
MKNFRRLLAVCTILIIGMVSCSKTGTTGATGPAGPAGPAGPDSVVYSQWNPLTMNLITPVTNGDSVYTDTILAASVTKAIIDQGVILTYVDFQESDGTDHVVDVSALVPDVIEDYSVGKINLIADIDLTGLPFRYITIPGTLVTGNSAANMKVKGVLIKDLKAMSFDQAQKVLSGPNN